MIMTEERMILKGQAQLEEMIAVVRRAAQAGRPIDQVERSLWKLGLELSRMLLEAYVAKVGPGDLGETLLHEGRQLRRLEELHERRYVSVFGELTVRRHVYGSRETQKHEVIPADAVLCLPASDFSSLLQEWDQSFCVQGSYAESRQTVQRILGLGQSIRSLEQMSVSMAGEVEEFRQWQPAPAAADEGRIVVLTADG